MDYRKDGQLTVLELIKLLKKQPKDSLVWHEGCDCHGAADRVEYDFMRGDELYKSHWSNGQREEVDLVIRFTTVRSRWAFFIHIKLKRILKESKMAQALYRIMSRLRYGKSG